MASYYRKGSTFAVNFVDIDDPIDEHRSQILFVESMQQEMKLAEYLDYEERVIENQESSGGGEGKRINRAYEKGEPLIIVTD